MSKQASGVFRANFKRFIRLHLIRFGGNQMDVKSRSLHNSNELQTIHQTVMKPQHPQDAVGSVGS